MLRLRRCDAILQGLSYLVPQRVLTLFTAQQLELLCCGAADIDLETLRAKTKCVLALLYLSYPTNCAARVSCSWHRQPS